MRVVAVKRYGDPEVLEVREMPDPQVNSGEVLIRVKSVGVNFADLMQRMGIYPGVPKPPFVPGFEVAGVVEKVGDGGRSGDSVDFRPGDAVCAITQYNASAQWVAVSARQVYRLPAGMPFEDGAALPVNYMTAYHAMFAMGKLQSGDRILIHGAAGGVGIAAIQGARIAGAAEIVAVDMVDSKLKDALRFGATMGVKPDELGTANAEINGPAGGFDYAFECIGLPETIRAAYDAARRGGTAVIVGAGSNEKNVEFNCFELFFMEKKLLGSYYGSADVRTEFSRLIRLWKSGRLDLEGMISSRMDLSKAQDAFDAMKKGEIIRQILTF